MLMKEIFDLSKGSLQPWRVDTDYTIGQLVYTGGSIYKALTAHHSATDVFETDADEYWELIVGGSNGGSNIPVGGIVPFSGDRLPTGYLYCRGQEVSRQTYSQLFKAIGTTYGAGDGATTFNIPDLRGRVPVGQAVDITFDNGDNVFYFRSLGESSGEVAEYIKLKHLPAHTHELQDKTHYHDGYDGTSSDGSYTETDWINSGGSNYSSRYVPIAKYSWNSDSGDNITGGGDYYVKLDGSNFSSLQLSHKHRVKGATIKNWRTKHSVLGSDYKTLTQKPYVTLQPYLTVDYIICFRSQLDLSELTVDEWQPQTQYYADDIVYYGGKIYKCKPNGDHVSGNILDTAELENWILLSGTDEAFEMTEWEANFDYVVGDLVWHDGTVYRAKAEHTSNTFETEAQTNWDVVIAPHFSNGIKLSATFNTLTPIEDMIAYMKSQEYHVDSTGGVKYLFDINTSSELSPGRCMKFFCEATYVSEDLVYFEATPQQRFGYTSGDVGVVKYQGVFSEGVFHGWQPIDSIKQWLSHVSYNKDDMVFHDGYLYSRIADGQIEADFDETEWKRYVTSDEIDVNESLKAWQQETDYKVGNLAYINHNLYRVVTEHTSTTVFEDDIANWQLIVGMDMNQWQPDTSYVVGDLAYNNKILYEVITDHTSTTVFEDDIANWKPIVGIGQQYADEIDNAKISNDTKEYATLKERLDMTQVHVIDDGHIDINPALVLPVGTLATFPNTEVAGAIYRCVVESQFGGGSTSQNPVRNPENWELVVSLPFVELENLGKIPDYALLMGLGNGSYDFKKGDLCYWKDSVWECLADYHAVSSGYYETERPDKNRNWIHLYGGYQGYVAYKESVNWAEGNTMAGFTSLDDRLNRGLIEQYEEKRDGYRPLWRYPQGGSPYVPDPEPYEYSEGSLCQHDGYIFRRKVTVYDAPDDRPPFGGDEPEERTDMWDEYLINKDLHVNKYGYMYDWFYGDDKYKIDEFSLTTHYAVKHRLDKELIPVYHKRGIDGQGANFNPLYYENDLVQLKGNLYKCISGDTGQNDYHPETGMKKDLHWDRYVLMSDVKDVLDAMDAALTNEHGDKYDTLKERLDIEGIARYTDSGNVVYNTNDLVHKDGIIYKCLEDNVNGAWDETKWVGYATLDDMQEVIDARTNGHDVEYTNLKERLDLETIELYSTDAIYDVDDLVQLDGVIYKRKTATGTVDGVFNEQQWTRYVTDDEVILFEKWQPNTTYEQGTFVYEPSGYITTAMGMFMGTGNTPTWGKNAQEADVVVAPTSDEAVTYKSDINGDIVQMVISDVLRRMPYATGAKHTYYTRVNIMDETAVTNNPFAAVNSFGDNFGVFVEVYRNVGTGANFTLFAYADAASKNDTLEYMFYGSYIDPNFDENNPTSNMANFTGWKKVNGVKPYSANKIYQINDMVFKDGKLYSRTVETGTLDVDFDETQWTRYLTEDDMFNPQPWQPNTNYNAGDVYYKNGHLIKTRFNTTTGNEFSWGGMGANEEVLAAPTSDVPMSNRTGINGDIIEYLVTDLFTKYPNCRLYRTKHTYCFNIRELAGVTNNPFRTVPMANTDHSLFIEVYKSDTHKLNFYAYADNTNICESISHIFYGSYIDDTATNAYDPAKFSGWKAIDGVKLYQPNLAYKTNDMVFHDGNLYSRTVQTDVLDVDFDETQWQRYLTEDDLFDPKPWQPNTQYSAGDIVYKDNHLILMTGNRNDTEFTWGDTWNRKMLVAPTSDEHMTMVNDINGDIVEYLIEDLFDRYPDSHLTNSKHTYCFNVLEQADVTNNPFRTTAIFNTMHSLFIEVYRSGTHKFNLYAYADSTVECESVSHIFYGTYVDDTRTNAYDATKFSGWKAVDGIKAYNANLVYKINDVVFYDGDLYSRIVQTDVIDGAWDRTQWQRYLTEEEAFTPKPWQPNTTFKAGQPIYKDGFLYAHKMDMGTGAEFSWGIAADTNRYDIYAKPGSDSYVQYIGGINGDIVGKIVQDIFDRLPYVDNSKHSYVTNITHMGTDVVENNPFVMTGQFNEDCKMFIDVYRIGKHSMDLYAYATGMSGIDHVHMYHGYYGGNNPTYDPANFSGWQPIDGLKSFEANKVIYTIDDMVTKDGETYRRIVETGTVDTAWDDTQWVRFLTTADNITGAQSDWNETDAGAEGFILNKPAIGDLTTLVTNDKTSIVAAINEAAASGVQPDWEVTDDTSFAFIKNKPAIGDINTLLTDDQTTIVASINEIHEELEDFVLHEDYTGTAAVTTDLSTRVADLEVDTAALMAEIEDARESTDGTAHGNIGQRIDAIEDGYLPLTGGIVTGDVHVTQTLNGTNIGTLKVSSPPGETLLITSNRNIYLDSTDGLYIRNMTNHADLTIRPNTDKTTFTTTGNQFYFEGEVKFKHPNGLRLTANNGTSTLIRNDGNHLYILTTDTGDEDGWFNSLRPFRINLTNGTVTMEHILEVDTEVKTPLVRTDGNLDITATGGIIAINSPMMFRDKTMYDGGNVTVTSNTDSKALTINSFQVGEVAIGCSNTGCNFSTTMNYFTFDKPLYTSHIHHPTGNLTISGNAGSVQCDGTFGPAANNVHHLGVDGLRWVQVWTTNGVVQGSDENLKEDIRTVSDEDYFEMIRGTEVKSYLYKQSQDGVMVASDRTQETVDNNELSLGVVAQDLANYESSKYVLQEGESGYSINLYNYTASVHSALRHEIALREQLEQENQELKDRLAAIEAHLGL